MCHRNQTEGVSSMIDLFAIAAVQVWVTRGGALGLVLFVLTGCGLLAERSQPAPPPESLVTQRLLAPTFTPTPIEAATSLSEPVANAGATLDIAATPLPIKVTLATSGTALMAEVTPVSVMASQSALTFTQPALPLPAEDSSLGYFTVSTAANLRTGPGTAYALAGTTSIGQSFAIQGRTEEGEWLQICCGDDGQPAWIFTALGVLEGSTAVIPVLAIAPPPTPTLLAEAMAASATAAGEDEPAALLATNVDAAVQVAIARTDAESTPVPAGTNLSVGGSPYPPGGPIRDHPGTAGEFLPDAQYQIVHFKVLGEAENNGGIFSFGGQHHIFVTVLDEDGNGLDGVLLKDAIGDRLEAVTGDKGPGQTEIEMYWDGYKLYVASDPTGPVTSQISSRLNLSYPHIPDIVGKLGSLDNEYAVCPTTETRCTPPFHHVHFSYELVFQKVR
jgi:SH3-like domain-containing protein